MSLRTIIDRVTGVLGGVPGIGQVHGYVRHIDKAPEHSSAAAALCVKDDVLNVWFVTRAQTEASEEDCNSTDYHERHVILIEGWLGLDDADASEETFQDLVETIRTEFRRHLALGRSSSDPALTALAGVICGPLSCVIDHNMFGSVLAHHARLTLPVTEWVSVSDASAG